MELDAQPETAKIPAAAGKTMALDHMATSMGSRDYTRSSRPAEFTNIRLCRIYRLFRY
jgi:hypothetical protein